MSDHDPGNAPTNFWSVSFNVAIGCHAEDIDKAIADLEQQFKDFIRAGLGVSVYDLRLNTADRTMWNKDKAMLNNINRDMVYGKMPAVDTVYDGSGEGRKITFAGAIGMQVKEQDKG